MLGVRSAWFVLRDEFRTRMHPDTFRLSTICLSLFKYVLH
jgi:hypothetical protein